MAGVVTALSYGTAGLSVGQRVFGLTDAGRHQSHVRCAPPGAPTCDPISAGQRDFEDIPE
ncbi:hypothetical protein [Nocardia vaccinii]|uniref:hypothetical protein n=1 Tax=Nocardia vaccinii TaxID=1822 RepID=UPI0035A234D8